MKTSVLQLLALAAPLLAGCQRLFPLPMGGVVAAIKQAGTQPTTPPDEPVIPHPAKTSGVLLFIAAGQSNMVGQHPIEYPPEPKVTVVFGDRKGPAIPFASELLQLAPDVTEVIIIRCAVNSTHIDTWKKGNGLYDACMNDIATLNRPDAQVAGFLFYQGESDARGNINWATPFMTIVNDIRADVHDNYLPVIFCQLATTTDVIRDHWQDIKNQQASIHLPNVVMVKTDDQPLLDSVHLTQDGDTVVGERMARAYVNL